MVFCGRGEACQKMIRENRECVTIHPFATFAGNILMCHIIFASQGITSHMAPSKAVNKIENLLISSTENGVQDHNSLLDSYKLLVRILTEKGVQRPVVVLSDGHSSRFDCHVLQFLQENSMRLFISPPDTTGVTQMLDQVNQALHSKYREVKSDLFTANSTVNREGFMTILADVWPTWTTRESLIKAGKRVGISNEGLSVEFMQQDKFETAASCIESSPEKPSTPDSSVISSPLSIRKGSANYYKAKFERAQEIIVQLQNSTPPLKDIGLLTVKKVTPKVVTKNVRVSKYMDRWRGNMFSR